MKDTKYTLLQRKSKIRLMLILSIQVCFFRWLIYRYTFFNSFFLKNNKYSKQVIYNNFLGHLEGGLAMYKTDKLLIYINEPAEQ